MATKREIRFFHLGAAFGMFMSTLILLAVAQTADAEEFLKGDLSAWVGAEHVSHDQDAALIGVSLEWDNFTLEIGHGTKRTKWRTIDENDWQMDEWQSGTNTSLLWHPFKGGFVRPHLIWRHASDVTRGRPFNDKDEPTSDFLGLGFKLKQPGEPIEVDVEYGYAARECAIIDCSKGAGTAEIRIFIRVRFWE